MELNSSNIKVAIIGGGLAGLAAASELSSRGINVTVFETAPQLGGRARSVHWKGLILDNGQHILLGAYHQTLRLMKKIGLNAEESLLRQSLNLNMRNAIHLKSYKSLPAPFNLLMGLMTCKGLNWSERSSAIRFLIQLKRINFKLDQDIPLNELLRRFEQPNNLIRHLWEPLCLAALNTPINAASSQIYLNVLKDSFNQKKTDSDLLLPRNDLSSLLAEPLADFIRAHQGEIKLNSHVKQLEKINHDFSVNGSNFTHVILAVAPFRLAEITESLGEIVATDLVTKFTYEPIYTVYLQYPHDVKLPQVMIGLTQTMSQWVFDRGQLNGQKGLLAVIISAKGEHQKLTHEALANQVIVELKTAFPNLPSPKWHKVIAEKRATFACTTNLKRPQQKTTIQNLYLAGDYTEGNYPATIEGAVQSGLSAAQLILQS
jgi:squalene-associated FAD-dependent desaturase